jgi:hypothetical protein
MNHWSQYLTTQTAFRFHAPSASQTDEINALNFIDALQKRVSRPCRAALAAPYECDSLSRDQRKDELP